MPHETDSPIHNSGDNTEKIPLIPHAHGTKEGACTFRRLRVAGIKTPSRIPMGRTNRKTTMIFRVKLKPIKDSK